MDELEHGAKGTKNPPAGTPVCATATLGPRQLLLEAAPCHKCAGDIPKDSACSVICDRCNHPFHLKCVQLEAPPSTYWYCPACSTHIAARGIDCPTEDLLLQQYLMGAQFPPKETALFQKASQGLCFHEGQLHKWQNEKWVPWPPAALQLLIMEEVHLA